MSIMNLFPTAVGMYDINREFTKEELKFCLEQDTKQNQGNTSSINTYILDELPLKDIKEFCNSSVEQYVKDVYQPSSNVEIYPTLSWLNYSETGQWHHLHSHPNSFISGVFYIQSDDEKDRIYFHKQKYNTIQIPTENFNEYNSKSWWLESFTGRLYLFPSDMMHNVQVVESDQTRISIAFNTWVKGLLGSREDLTELVLR